jgi:hypothetical protein
MMKAELKTPSKNYKSDEDFAQSRNKNKRL